MLLARILPHLLLSGFLSACSTTLVNEPDKSNFSDPSGVPWVESREYDVYVYSFQTDKAGKAIAKPVHYGRYSLGDKISGKIIDASRPKWTANYDAQAFSSGSLSLMFHENGSLKEAKISGQPGAAAGVKAITEAVNVIDEIEKKELERLEREKKLRDVRKELEDSQ